MKRFVLSVIVVFLFALPAQAQVIDFFNYLQLPVGKVGQPYAVTIFTLNGKPGYSTMTMALRFTGAQALPLPLGTQISAWDTWGVSVTVSGTPTQAGIYSVTVKGANGYGVATVVFPIVILPADPETPPIP